MFDIAYPIDIPIYKVTPEVAVVLDAQTPEALAVAAIALYLEKKWPKWWTFRWTKGWEEVARYNLLYAIQKKISQKALSEEYYCRYKQAMTKRQHSIRYSKLQRAIKEGKWGYELPAIMAGG